MTFVSQTQTTTKHVYMLFLFDLFLFTFGYLLAVVYVWLMFVLCYSGVVTFSLRKGCSFGFGDLSCKAKFGSLGDTMYCLYKAITGGDSF